MNNILTDERQKHVVDPVSSAVQVVGLSQYYQNE